ncbi:SPOSA6832_03212 [Sporobolomyces salmonicolor]|uniref:SPOSA6832_03212-mRNA-1:cds n=1 Tax=Sporidiobolus salmonicolor TaxID=5005 RepID=A0A0D6ENX4_SPOSA|nr:SPOSA6832_03212 [Sporobolomyces salmonicolor]
MILLPSALSALLSQLAGSDGAPHTALLAYLSSGAIVAAHSLPTQLPFPRASLQDLRDDDERAKLYAALAVGTWTEERARGTGAAADGTDASGPLMLETELGRIAVTAIGGFLLVLVGTEVSPWKVLDKKIRAAEEQLKEPLERVAS